LLYFYYFLLLFLSLLLCPPLSSLFPYTTLFRSTSLEVAISSSKDNLSYAELITHIGLFSLANIYVSILIFVWVNINKKDSISAAFQVYFDLNRLINVVVQEGIVRTNLRFAIIKRQSKPRDRRSCRMWHIFQRFLSTLIGRFVFQLL